MRAFVVAAAALGLAACAQAAPLFSFEGSLDGFVVDGTSTATLANSTIGATDGSQSLALTDGAWGQIKTEVSLAVWTEIKANPKISFDYTIVYADGAAHPGWDQSWGGWWGDTTVCINSEAGGWSQPASLNIDRTQGTHTATFDFSGFTIPAAPGGWSQVFIQHNWGATTPLSTLYIDNVRTSPVPEPTIMAGVAISSLGLMIRKRQK